MQQTEKTTISVTEENAERLHDLKSRGETYNDVISRLLAGEGN